MVEIVNKDRYGRSVGKVAYHLSPDALFDVNIEMICRGFAWWYQAYAKKDLNYRQAEAAAKAAKRGLWADKTQVAPWEWRSQRTAAKAR